MVSQPNAFGGFSGKVGRFLALSKKYTTKIFVNLFQVFNTNTGFSDVERFRGEPEYDMNHQNMSLGYDQEWTFQLCGAGNTSI